ncbi:hypothetical protein CLOSTMETH_00833 [[Clostridium] methylpentosum DSM 5476]|uniref:Uncharacterized protein n=1 Tax=[Clostridium] methylpentosum DSM 5476 TaxID=537013 RepID=C0EAH8_9FIRM|nr:hypothetical protein CLOSTMETH_00833 [[Clostridium] methylpentosum DSM 5476]
MIPQWLGLSLFCGGSPAWNRVQFCTLSSYCECSTTARIVQ